MKKLFTLIIGLYFTSSLFAQHAKPKALLTYPVKKTNALPGTQFRTTSNESERLDSIVNTVYKEVYVYNPNNDILKIIAYLQDNQTKKLTNVETREYSYDANRNLVMEILFLGKDQDILSEKITYTYNSNNNITERMDFLSSDGTSWTANEKDEFTYDANNMNIQTTNYAWNDPIWRPDNTTDYTYDINGKVIQSINSRWGTTEPYPNTKNEYTYNENSDLVEYLQYFYYDYIYSPKEWKVVEKTEYVFDSKGRNTSSINYSVEDAIETEQHMTELEYDMSDNVIKSAYYDSEGPNQWIPVSIGEATYDSSIPIEDLIVPPYYSKDYTHKALTNKFDYYNAGELVITGEGVFYYSGQITTSISGKATGNPADLKVYPNPTTGSVTFNNTAFTGQISLNLYDAQGKKSFSEQIENNKSISLQNLQKGIYFYQVINKDSYIYNGTLILE